MTEVRVIARSVARQGKEDQLTALLQGILVPRVANRDVNRMNSTSLTQSATSHKHHNLDWRIQAAIHNP